MGIRISGVYSAAARGGRVCCFAGALTALAFSLAGCGSGEIPRYQVTGTVTIDGEPVEEGEIYFHDVAREVDSDHGQIVDGEYTFRAKAGKKRVEITAFKLIGVTEIEGRPDKSGAPILEALIPPEYNTMSKLTVDVEPDDQNEFPFDLKSK
jgi:hypothetical protein